MKTLRPELPPGWRSALAAEVLAAVDPKAAHERWRGALSEAPDDPELLAAYATFLFDQNERPTEAEYLLRLALLKTPSDCAKSANLARLLLVEGRHAEGLEQLSSALKLVLAQTSPSTELLAELMFYLVAHDRSRGENALATLKRLIQSGVRTPGWNFEPTLFRAQEDNHPELALLRDMAKVLSHASDPAILQAHVAWRLA